MLHRIIRHQRPSVGVFVGAVRFQPIAPTQVMPDPYIKCLPIKADRCLSTLAPCPTQ